MFKCDCCKNKRLIYHNSWYQPTFVYVCLQVVNRILFILCLFCVYICVYIHFALLSKDVSSSVFQTPNVSKFEIMVLL